VTSEGIVVGDNVWSDAEFVDWLQFYEKVIAGIDERSAIVIETEPGIDCARLFEVLSMLSDRCLDRFLVERQAPQELVAEQQVGPSAVESDDELD
jgi:hypothetical protein